MDVIGLFGWTTLWIYFVVELVAAAAAGLAFRALNSHDKEYGRNGDKDVGDRLDKGVRLGRS